MSSNLLDAGFGTLAQLKARVFPAIMENYDGDGEFDDDLQAIGLGVAGMFNRHCNRKFQRGVDVVDDIEGGGSSVALSHAPVESVTAVSLVTKDASESILSSIYNTSLAAGIVNFDGYQGNHRDRIQITYTGGYWLGTPNHLAEGTQAKTVFLAIPANVSDVDITIPSPYDADDVAGVSVQQIAGTGQISVTHWSVAGSVVTVRLSSQAVDATHFKVALLLLKEPEAAVASGQPGGTEALPPEILNAWAMQAQASMQHLQTLWGAGVERTGDKASALSQLEMLPIVKQILNPYIRFAG